MRWKEELQNDEELNISGLNLDALLKETGLKEKKKRTKPKLLPTLKTDKKLFMKSRKKVQLNGKLLRQG